MGLISKIFRQSVWICLELQPTIEDDSEKMSTPIQTVTAEHALATQIF
jgi:hypothetical protein